MEEEATALVVSKRLKGKSYRAAAEVPKTEQRSEPNESQKKNIEAGSSVPKKEVKQRAKPTPSGLILEVVLSPRFSTKSDHSSLPSSPIDKDSIDSEDPDVAMKQRRAAAKRPIIFSDDESSEDLETLARPTKQSSAKPTKRRRLTKRESSPSSDYQGSSSEEQESNFEMASEDSDEDFRQKSKKSQTNLKPKTSAPKRSAKMRKTSEEDDHMDIDEPDSKKGQKNATKQKTTDDKEKPKKARRADSDPWKLGSKAVQNEWTYMKAPPFEMFHFARVVVDEYTYLDGKVHALVTNLSADRQWVLSGTPPIHDFGALKTISAFLNIHLGVDDEGEGRSAEVKKRTREQTGITYDWAF